MRVLVVNAGSSSLKLSLLGPDDAELARGEVGATAGVFDERALHDWLAEHAADGVDAVGHRVVHGGPSFTGPVVLDDAACEVIASLIPLAPLHQPAALRGIDSVRRALPGVPMVACFDTAFHATLPPAASTYAVPAEWRERFGVRRYGFHGLAHSYAARRAGTLLHSDRSELGIVTCHLGSGASLAAIDRGRSVDTTMGMTPLEGVVMATRSGSIDPGVITFAQRQAGLTPDQTDDALDRRSGLLALAGTPDMREVLLRRAAGDSDAALAFDVYVHALRGAVARMAVSLSHFDALVFTGGVGENAALVRSAVLEGLSLLGIALDRERNDDLDVRRDGDVDVTAISSKVHVLVVHAREDLEIVRLTREVLDR